MLFASQTIVLATITIISPEMDTVCYTLCVATPYILCLSVYFEVSPPPPENPRSAPAGLVGWTGGLD